MGNIYLIHAAENGMVSGLLDCEELQQGGKRTHLHTK